MKRQAFKILTIACDSLGPAVVQRAPEQQRDSSILPFPPPHTQEGSHNIIKPNLSLFQRGVGRRRRGRVAGRRRVKERGRCSPCLMSWRTAAAEGGPLLAAEPQQPCLHPAPGRGRAAAADGGQHRHPNLLGFAFFFFFFSPSPAFPPPPPSSSLPPKELGRRERWLELSPRERRCGAPGFSTSRARPCNGFQSTGFLRLLLDVLF